MGTVNEMTEETGVIDHPPPILIDHPTFLNINGVRWSSCSGEDWSKRAFFPTISL
jgi:hypothetical protein